MARAREVVRGLRGLHGRDRGGVRDPRSGDALALTQRFDELRDAATADERARRGGRGRADRVRDRDHVRAAGRTSRTRCARQRDARARLFALAAERGALLGATGTHPVEPLAGPGDHRHRPLPPGRRRAQVRGLAQQHVQPARARRRARRRSRDRRLRPAAAGAARSCSRSRPTRRSSTAATRACTPLARRSSPRASRAAASRTRSATGPSYADYVEFLVRTNSIVEHTQIWWSVRPHHSFGTVEVRICDAQTSAEDVDGAGRPDRRPASPRRPSTTTRACAHEPPARRFVEENLWRAIRHGLEGS